MKNFSFVIYEQIQLLKVSYERGDLEQFFKNFKDVRSYPYRDLISILEKENDECTKLDAIRGNFVHLPLKKKTGSCQCQTMFIDLTPARTDFFTGFMLKKLLKRYL